MAATITFLSAANANQGFVSLTAEERGMSTEVRIVLPQLYDETNHVGSSRRRGICILCLFISKLLTLVRKGRRKINVYTRISHASANSQTHHFTS